MTFLDFIHNLGYNYSSLAKKTGISRRTVEKYAARGRQLKNARAWLVISIADALGVTPKYLIDIVDEDDADGPSQPPRV